MTLGKPQVNVQLSALPWYVNLGFPSIIARFCVKF